MSGKSGRSGRPKNPPKPKKLLKEILPVNDIFDEDELVTYNQLIDIYTADFDENDLKSSDVDDILDLAKNRILEFRFLKLGKEDINKQMDVSSALEKLRKQNDKIKENLSARRRDRIDPNKYKGFSIVDLATAFDEDRKQKLDEKVSKLKAEREEALDRRGNYTGNRYDVDVKEH